MAFCNLFFLLLPYNHHKLEFRSIPCTFLGYSSNHKGYRCLVPSGRIYISRDVLFDEANFPFASKSSSPSTTSTVSHPSSFPSSYIPIINSYSSSAVANTFSVDDQINTCSNRDCAAVQVSPHCSSTSSAHSSSSTSSSSSSTRYMLPTALPLPSPLHSNASSSTKYLIPHQPSSPVSIPSLPSKPVRRHISHPLPLISNSHTMTTRAKAGISKPKILMLSKEPSTVKAAITDTHWHQAMIEEYTTLVNNKTWDLVPLPRGKTPIGCKWVFKVKHNPDGSISRHKARLVAKGFHQIPGFDFSETFSPVIKPVTTRVVLSIALSNGWSIRQLDVNNAFLNGILTEEVFMVQPEGFSNGDPHTICKLNKSLYGLKQSPRTWFDKLSTTLLSFGFSRARSDHSLFVKHSPSSTIYVLVYVDDILVTGNVPSEVSYHISLLHKQFALKDLGSIHYFLGVEVDHLPDGSLLLRQSKYIRDLLLKVQMHDAKPQPTPMASTVRLTNTGSDCFDDPKLYRSVVGALQYACITRPELAFSVNKVSQFMQKPLCDHWVAVKRILRYLQGTSHLGLHIQKCSHPRISAMCDADWAADPTDRRSTSGFCVFFGPNLVSWQSKKQSVVSRSSTEAGYRVLALVVSEVTWLQSLLRELFVPLPSEPPLIYCDNMSGVLLAANPILHSRTKHVELDIHFVREKVQQHNISVCHVASKDQVADILTKPLPKPAFLLLRSKLHVDSPP